MKQWIWRMPVVLLLGMLAASCGTSTQMAGVWRDPDFKPAADAVKKVMIVGIGENELRVKSFESQFGQKFSARKLAVVPGSSVIPRDSVTRSDLMKIVKDSGSNLVIVVRFVGMDTETQYVPGSSYYAPTGGYAFAPYYYSSYAVIQEPGYMVNYKVYKVETHVYDVTTEKLIWSGLSHTTDPVNAQDAIDSLGNRVVNELVHDKIIK